MRTVEISAMNLALLLDALDGVPMSDNVRAAFVAVSRDFSESLERQARKNGGRNHEND